MIYPVYLHDFGRNGHIFCLLCEICMKYFAGTLQEYVERITKSCIAVGLEGDSSKMKKICTHNCIIYVLSFMLPVLILAANFALWQAYPFGNSTVLMTDLYHQYIHFYSYLYDAIKGDNSLIYNWQAGLGTNYIGNIAYYTSSPFLAIIFSFSKYSLDVAVIALILLKIGAAGLAMSIFIRRRFPAFQALEVILFSAFYALMSYSVIYYYNVMWLDSLIWLPLILLATDLLITQRKVALFILFLAVMFLSNFYIAYMIGLFVFLYFASEMIVNGERLTRRELLGASSKFVAGVLIAAGISSILTIPTFYQIMGSESTQVAVNTSASGLNFHILDLFAKMFSGAYDSIKDGTPNVYIGSFIWILVPAFFLNKQIGIADKIRWGALLLILLISMELPALNMVWHGFDSPNWFPYRYSFIFSFILFLMSLRAYQEMAAIRFRSMLLLFLLPLAVLLLNFLYAGELKLQPVIHSGFILLFALIIFARMKMKKHKALLYSLLLIYTIGELAFNTGTLYMKSVDEIGVVSRDQYTVYNDYIHTVNRLKEHDPALPYSYRVETDINKTNNDSLRTGHGSFSHSSSMASGELIDTLEALGFSTRKANYNEKGSTLLTDSLLGLKYMIHSGDLGKYGYDKLFSYKDLHVFENKYALPIGFVVSNRIKDIDLSNASHPFALQNRIVQQISNSRTDLFTPISPIKTEYINAKVLNGTKAVRLLRDDEKQPIKIKYQFLITDESQLYALLTTSLTESAKVTVNNRWIADYPARNFQGILDAGTFNNEQVSLEVAVDQQEAEIERELFYTAVIGSYPDLIRSIDRNSFRITKLAGTRLEGVSHVKQENEWLFLSIPWDKGWLAVVDGQEIVPVKVLGSFMGIPLGQGEHNIALHFVPEGYVAGKTISLISLLILLTVWWKERASIKAREEKGAVASGS